MIIYNFSSGLDDMKRKDQRSIDKVILALEGMKRYSIFEVTQNHDIANTMTRIVKLGLIESTPNGFPWTSFVITEAGKAMIAQAKETT